MGKFICRWNWLYNVIIAYGKQDYRRLIETIEEAQNELVRRGYGHGG